MMVDQHGRDQVSLIADDRDGEDEKTVTQEICDVHLCKSEGHRFVIADR